MSRDATGVGPCCTFVVLSERLEEYGQAVSEMELFLREW